jgi:hypothetical protein
MSTRLINSDSITGVDTLLENMQDQVDIVVADNIWFHDFLSESEAAFTAAITRLSIENILTNQTLSNLPSGNIISNYTTINNGIDIFPKFPASIVTKEFDYHTESSILVSSQQLLLADTTNSAFNVILPSGATIGTTVAILDYSSMFNINSVTVTTNQLQKIQNTVEDYILNLPNLYNFIYIGEQFGWILTNDNTESTLVFVNHYYNVQNRDKLLIDTLASSFTVFLDPNPNQYDAFTVIDVGGNFDNKPLIIDANGQSIFDARSTFLDISNISISFIFNTKWIYTEDLPTPDSIIKSISIDYECVNNDYLFVTDSLTITLPVDPNIGDKIVIIDNCDFETNLLTVNSNGSKINGSSSDLVGDIKYSSITLVFINPIKGWLIKG